MIKLSKMEYRTMGARSISVKSRSTKLCEGEVYAIISGSTKMFSFGSAAFTRSARK
jgi:hypothetical protein